MGEDNYDLGYIQIIHNEKYLYEKFDQRQKDLKLVNNRNKSSIRKLKTGRYVCDYIGCDKKFKYFRSFLEHKKKHLAQKSLPNTQRDRQKSGSREEAFSLNFDNQSLNSDTFNLNESNCEKQIWHSNGSNGSQNSPKTSAQIQTESNSRIKRKASLNKVYKEDVIEGEDNFLCDSKGLSSVKGVKEYYKSIVVNGRKKYLCIYASNECEYSSVSTSIIARHINFVHIGFEIRCDQQNCFKVFRSPQAYKQHVKKHICGFDIGKS